MIEIDGSYGEGGGQIVRTALALSTLTGKPFRVTKIRVGRKQPGLKAQHLHCIRALEKLCSAQTVGAEMGSTTLEFVPGKLEAENIEVDIGTAGSVTLFLQALLLPLMFADKPCKIKVIGGTNGKWAMPVEYFQHVLVPKLTRFGDVNLSVIKRGYYPKGGGIIELKVKSNFNLGESFDTFLNNLREKVTPYTLTRKGELQIIKGVSHAAKQLASRKVADRQKTAAESSLKMINIPKSISVEYVDTYSIGSGITLWAKYSDADVVPSVIVGGDALGEKGTSAEDVGRTAAKNLEREMRSTAPVDHYLADNLIPFMALLAGSKIVATQVSMHVLSNIYACEQFLDIKFKVEGTNISSELS